MKRFGIYIIISISLAVYSCVNPNDSSKSMLSYSGKYKLIATINNDETDNLSFNCVLLNLFDSANNSIVKIQTKASNNIKWAVDWYPGKDTIVFNSSDIGIYAYYPHNNTFDTVMVSSGVDSIARIIFRNKYKN